MLKLSALSGKKERKKENFSKRDAVTQCFSVGGRTDRLHRDLAVKDCQEVRDNVSWLKPMMSGTALPTLKHGVSS